MKNKLKKSADGKTLRLIEKDTFFKKRCVESFFFLLEKYGFDIVTVEELGNGSLVFFSVKKNEYPKVIAEYETGTLPTIQIEMSSEKKILFSEADNIKNYPAHLTMQSVVKKEINSVDQYIKELGDIWRNRYNEVYAEVGSCLNFLASQVESYLKDHNPEMRM